MIKTNNLKSMKQANMAAILSCLYYGGEASRLELSEKCGLSAASMTTLTRDLILKGVLVQTREIRKTTSGRREMLLDIDYNNFFAVSVCIESERTSISICTLKEILNTTVVLTSKIKKDVNALIELIKQQIDVSGCKIDCIGLGIAGKIDCESGEVIDSYGVYEDNFDLKSRLHNYFNVPIYIANNVHTQADSLIKGENDNFLFVKNSPGIGSAIVYEGNVVQGRNFFGLGMGHAIVNSSGEVCRCGRKGCLETYLNETVVVENYISKTGKTITFSELVAGYKKNHIVTILMQMPMKYLAYAIANVSTTVDPKKVVVAGGFFTNIEFVEDLKLMLDEFGCDIDLEYITESPKLKIMSGGKYALKKLLFEV
ncbi:MAG: ROK family protein [Clostridia bacterium]